MATTLTEIANSALVKIGAATILDLNDGSVAANTCLARINPVRRMVLRMHPWNCALARVSLAPLTSTPAFGFDYSFQLPSDCLRVLAVEPDETAYRIEGRNILADSNAIDLKFITDVSQVELLDELLAEAISCYLAWDIAYKITQSSEAKAEAWRMFKTVLGSAKSVDAQEERDYEVEANLFIDSRIGIRGRLQ